jgi:DNA/RNA-binding domain of Phe-tRNA-synthetase-like protein
MFTFRYHTDILDRYPHVRGGVILARGLQNGPTPGGLQDAFDQEQRQTLARIGDTPLSQLQPLAAWRAAFREFGVNPTKYRSAAEALLRRLTKKGDIPSINALVDLCNLVSIRYALPVAAFNTRALEGAVTVRFAEGDERYTPLGREEVEHPEPGEVIFSDESKRVIARRWCWRQSDDSAARAGTTEAILTVEAHHEKGEVDVQAALNDLLGLLREYVGGEYDWGLLGPERSEISA